MYRRRGLMWTSLVWANDLTPRTIFMYSFGVSSHRLSSLTGELFVIEDEDVALWYVLSANAHVLHV